MDTSEDVAPCLVTSRSFPECGSRERPCLRLVQAVPEIETRSGKPAIIIGGLAVICRLGGGYRATSDLDTVNRRSVDEPAQLEVLVSSGAARSDAVGVIIPTPAGDVKVDVLEVSDSDLQPLPEDPIDRLHVLSHAWAAETASFVTIGATDGTQDGYQEVLTRVAEPGPLIAMKLQSVMNRPAAKEGLTFWILFVCYWIHQLARWQSGNWERREA